MLSPSLRGIGEGYLGLALLSLHLEAYWSQGLGLVDLGIALSSLHLRAYWALRLGFSRNFGVTLLSLCLKAY